MEAWLRVVIRAAESVSVAVRWALVDLEGELASVAVRWVVLAIMLHQLAEAAHLAVVLQHEVVLLGV